MKLFLTIHHIMYANWLLTEDLSMVLMFSALFVLMSMGLWLPLLEDEIGGMLSRLQCMCV
jgi:hypothetical protein